MIEALAPVAVLIGLGYALRASGFMPEGSWAPVDRLVYYVLFPALLVRELAGAELAGLPVMRVAAVLLTTQLVMAALAAWSARACASMAPPSPAPCNAWCAGTPTSRWRLPRRYYPPRAFRWWPLPWR